MDTELLLIVKNKNNYLRFKPYIQEHVLSKEALLIYNTLDSFYKQFPTVTDLDWSAFETYFFIYRNSVVKREAAPIYRSIFASLKATTTTPVALDTVLTHYITQDYAQQIGEMAIQVREGGASVDDIEELVDKHNKELGRAINPTDLFVMDGVEEVLREASAPGFNWRLNELNISCGPLRKGDFVVVAAYVETGKTTFTASEVSHMATQIKDTRPVIWVNNEERSAKVLLRIQQAALGISMKDIQTDPAKATAEYEKLMGMKNRILVLNNDSGMNNVARLTPLFRELNPALIVFDQLDKVEIASNRDEGEPSKLGRIYKWARDLSHEFGPVIAISQTDASSEGDQFIRMNQLRGSKVDKPGEADAIITIGKSMDRTLPNKRYIHVPKNKLFGGPMSDEKDRHGYWEVEIDALVARYVGTK